MKMLLQNRVRHKQKFIEIIRNGKQERDISEQSEEEEVQHFYKHVKTSQEKWNDYIFWDTKSEVKIHHQQ